MAKGSRARGTHSGGGALRGRGGSATVARSRSSAPMTMHSATGGIGQFSAASGGHGHGSYHGFKSKKQWRWAWASKQPWADKKSHETAGGPKIRYRRLPESKHSGRKGSRTPT